MPPRFLRFNGELRPSQQEMVEVAQRQLSRGNRRLHFNAPPGTGKTLLGLYLWSELQAGTALVLSPNTAIAAQWVEQARWFSRQDGEPIDSLISRSASKPNLLTSVTYQSLAATSRKFDFGESLDVPIDETIVSRLSDDAMERMIALREFGVGILILDECHHLTGHWGRIIEKLIDQLSNPIVLGLTGTPPDPAALNAASLAQYDRLLGPIDHEIPIPTIVKSGFLAPFQDLVWFVEPTDQETQYINDTSHESRSIPHSTVLAHSAAKLPAAVTILRHEFDALGEKTRIVVITDFEKHAMIETKVECILDPEAGGAVAVLRAVLADAATNRLDPILVTGTTVLVDSDSVDTIQAKATQWIRNRGLKIQISVRQYDEFSELCGSGSDWGPQNYVLMITELFTLGDAKCLIGTRGLLGEGWDAPCINVLVDLTSAATSTSVRQIRGRAIRLDPRQPAKVANHWDVVCLVNHNRRCAFDDQPDYQRLVRKHDAWFGVCDDGEIEKGVRHLHPDLEDQSIDFSTGTDLARMNADMMARVVQRDRVRKHWRVGEKFEGIPRMTVDVHWPATNRQDRALELVSMADSVYQTLVEIGQAEPNGRVRVSRRQSDHYRLQFEGVNDSTRQRCCDSIIELLSPLDSPRYVIERCRQHSIIPRWAGWLPSMLRQRFTRVEHERIAWHMVPSTIARRRAHTDLLQKFWYHHVSRGQVVYLTRNQREEFVAKAKEEFGNKIVRVTRREVIS